MKAVLEGIKQDLSGYGMGNFINLYRQLQLDLKGYDFSGHTIWQANFQALNLYDTNFAQADFRHCRFNLPIGGITALAISPDNTLLAVADHIGNIQLWDLKTYQYRQTLTGHTGWVFSLVFSPDRNHLISSSGDATLKLWQTQDGRCLRTLTGHSQLIISITFSGDGRWVASGSNDKTIKIWDIEQHQCLQTLRKHQYTIETLAFSPSGKLLASGDENATIKLWDTESWDCISTFHLPGPYEKMNITGATGLSVAEKSMLMALGAIAN